MFASRPPIWLILLPIVVHWPALIGWLSADPIYLESGLGHGWISHSVLPGLPGWIDGNAGVTLEALGRAVARDWRAGNIPWWNPYSGVGMPMAGEMQPAAFLLPFVLLLGIAGGVLLLKITLMGVAGLSAYRLLSHLGLSRAASLMGGLLFELNGTFAWDSDSSSLPVAFLPMFLLGIERALAAARAGMPGGWRLMSVAMTYSILAGFPERAYVDGLLALCWSGLRLVQAGQHRLGFALRLASGGTVSLFICAPLLLAFVSFLGQADPALRNMGHAALQPGNFAMFLFPYVYGPFFFHDLFVIWYSLGGYLSLPTALAGLFGIVITAYPGTRERGLRLLLTVWILMALAKSGGMRGVTDAWNSVPMIAQSLFFRYSNSSWEFCAILLAAFALDEIPEFHKRHRRKIVGLAGTLCVLLAVAALAAGRPIWRDLGSVPGGRSWFYAAVGWGFACACGVALAGAAGRKRILMTALSLDAILQFSLPLLSGTPRNARDLDLGPIAFLKANIGLSRIYSLGPLTSNYGAFFGIPEINHIYAPVPRNWVDYIHANLDPLAGSVTFNGSNPPPAPGMETRPEALRRRLPAYEALGVKYVLVNRGDDPFTVQPTGSHWAGNMTPLALPPEEAAQGDLPAGAYSEGPIGQVGIQIGTFFGHANGRMTLTLCSRQICAQGSAALVGAADNAMLTIKLDRTIDLGASDPLHFTVTHLGGTSPVALWLWRNPENIQASTTTSRGVAINGTPQMRFTAVSGPDSPHLVYSGRVLDIFELPNPAPYFEAPGCTLHDTTKETLTANCLKPSHLIRRELSFPGWHATANGATVDVNKNGLFQTIMLPDGESHILFHFAPPFIAWAWAACALGLAMLCVVPITSRYRARPAIPPRSEYPPP